MKLNKNINWEFNDEEEFPIPDGFEEHKEFYDFLVDNKILVNYLYSIGLKGEKLKDFFIRIENYEFINQAFNWRITSEGHGFWKVYNRKWKKKFGFTGNCAVK